jgi:hypothetical protein
MKWTAMEQLAQLVNANERLVWRGRYIDTNFLLEAGDDAWLINISAGRVASVTRVARVMPSWTFALRASRETWEQFWLALPPPGYHDLMAMLKYRRLRIEGDLHPFMSNLLYFKDVMASLRPAAVAA